jgi:hypothetical protein
MAKYFRGLAQGYRFRVHRPPFSFHHRIVHKCASAAARHGQLKGHNVKTQAKQLHVAAHYIIIGRSHPRTAQSKYDYPRYRPYRNATNCLAPRIRFLMLSSLTPDCRNCCSNLTRASLNSFRNSLSITLSSTLGMIFLLHQLSTRSSNYSVVRTSVRQTFRILQDSSLTSQRFSRRKPIHPVALGILSRMTLHPSEMEQRQPCFDLGLWQNCFVHRKRGQCSH